MPTSTTDLVTASRALDPPSRALMNLWLNRGLGDSQIARLSGGTAEEISVRRDRLVLALAQEVGSPVEEVRAALDGLTTERMEPEARQEPEPEPEPEPAPAPEPRPATRVGSAPPPAPAARGVILGDPEPEAGTPELIVPGEATSDAEPAPDIIVPPQVTATAERPGRKRIPDGPPAAAEDEAREDDPHAHPLPGTLAVTLAIVIVLLLLIAVLAG